MTPRSIGKAVWRIGSKRAPNPSTEIEEDLSPVDPVLGALFGTGATETASLDSIPKAMIVVDLDSKQIVNWNEAASALVGYERQEALRMWIYELLPTNLQARFRADLTALRINGRSRYFEPGRPSRIPIVRKDGSSGYASVLISPFSTSGADGPYIVGLMREVTGADASQVSESGLEEIVAAEAEALLFTDPMGRVTHWTPGAEKMFRYKPEERIDFGELLPVGQVGLADEIFAKMRQGGSWLSPEMSLCRRAGLTFQATVEAHPVLTDAGRCVGAVFVVSELVEEAPPEGSG